MPANIRQYKLNWKPRPGDPREWRHRMLVPLTVDRSQPRSLAQYFGPVDDQGAEGSCTANSGCLAQEACGAISGAPVPVAELSREELYWDERSDEGGQQAPPADNGAYTADSFDSALRRGGLVLESVWPYDANPAAAPPAAVAGARRYLYFASHAPVAGGQFVDGIIAGFDALQPAVIGFTFYDEFFSQFESTAVLAAAPTSAVAGGHQVTAKYWIPPCAALPAGGVGCQNSWGLTSPARPDLHPDARAGDIILPSELFANGVVGEVRTVQPRAASPTPASLTVRVIQSGAALAGRPATFQVSSSGAVQPAYAIIPGDGQPATAWQTSGTFTVVFANAGSYTLNAYAVDLANPIQEPNAQITVVVGAQPGPAPTPSGPTIAKLVASLSDGSSRQLWP